MSPHFQCYQIGEKGGPKPRLLKVTVESDEEKAAIL